MEEQSVSDFNGFTVTYLLRAPKSFLTVKRLFFDWPCLLTVIHQKMFSEVIVARNNAFFSQGGLCFNPIMFSMSTFQNRHSEGQNDTLVRCDSCFGLKEILERSHSDIERREAKRKLDQHYDYISRQRVIIQTLCAQSRDPNCDVRVVMIDGMSNRHTKLPRLVDRPKFVTDSIRVIMSLTTVQIARSEGDIYWSSAATLHSSLLFNAENDQNAFKLFKEAFLPEEFVPTIRKPETTIIENKVNELKRQCGELLTDQNHQNFCSYIVEYGKKSFRHTMTDINQKRQLVPSPATSPDDPHQTVLQFLKRNGYPTGKMPKNPSI
ncbi:hypothetical protein GCK72_006816 [Caenorhabditis remanei]|uniref:Uncharacterized protein n=1 Tax=Caenorhabditis remanei TaxID=31234 RepID=A0A6A5HG93_CAERE|nr:hypothetical protein GCK72_006816 [Caenorhabditis remanei]KAF1766858.1 hypothetical protein GCK72_006816 [Caenorhabditis remanei]